MKMNLKVTQYNIKLLRKKFGSYHESEKMKFRYANISITTKDTCDYNLDIVFYQKRVFLFASQFWSHRSLILHHFKSFIKKFINSEHEEKIIIFSSLNVSCALVTKKIIVCIKIYCACSIKIVLLISLCTNEIIKKHSTQ